MSGSAAADMIVIVVCRSWMVMSPILTARLGPSVRNISFAGTCSVSPRTFAAYAPAGCTRMRSGPRQALWLRTRQMIEAAQGTDAPWETPAVASSFDRRFIQTHVPQTPSLLLL